MKTSTSERKISDEGSSSKINECVYVNHNCQIKNSVTNKSIPGMYGIGQGFSLATSDLSVQAEQRQGAKADSVGLYIKQIGNKILSQIIPNAKTYMIQQENDYIQPDSQVRPIYD